MRNKNKQTADQVSKLMSYRNAYRLLKNLEKVVIVDHSNDEMQYERALKRFIDKGYLVYVRLESLTEDILNHGKIVEVF